MLNNEVSIRLNDLSRLTLDDQMFHSAGTLSPCNYDEICLPSIVPHPLRNQLWRDESPNDERDKLMIL